MQLVVLGIKCFVDIRSYHSSKNITVHSFLHTINFSPLSVLVLNNVAYSVKLLCWSTSPLLSRVPHVTRSMLVDSPLFFSNLNNDL